MSKSDSELKNTVQKAQRAEQLLNDPMIQEFIVAVRGKLLNEFESTGLASEEERLNAWQKSQILSSFLEEFTKAIKNGKTANHTLMERARQQIKRII
jgi:hypothetical protein